MLSRYLVLLSLLAVGACAPVKVTDYSDMQPVLVLEEFFQGRLSAHGVVKDRGGRVTRSFVADIDASWSDGVGTLVEDFVFDDGEQQQRIWTLTPTADGRYIGTAGDVTGEGMLTVAGNSMFLDYVLQVPYRGDIIELRVDDRMYLVSDDVLINESTLNKFGLQVGALLLVIRRLPTAEGET